MKKILNKKVNFQCSCGCYFVSNEYIIKDIYENWKSASRFIRPPYSPAYYTTCPKCNKETREIIYK